MPEAQRVIAIVGENRERRDVDDDQSRGIGALRSRPAQERERANAGDRCDDRLQQHERRIKGESQEREAAEPRKPHRAAS